MATLAFGLKHSNILHSGIASWQVKWGIGETPDDAFYSFGALGDASLKIDSLQTVGEYGESRVYGMMLSASCKILCTDKLTVLKLLHNLSNAQLLHKITAINGKTFHGNFGTKWRFDSSADYNGNRFVQVDVNHYFLTTHASVEDLAEVLDTPDADGTPDAGDTLTTWSAATKFPAGISAFTIDPAGDSETIGKYRNAKFVAESLSTTDEKGRIIGFNAIKVTIEAEMLQTSDELAYSGANFPSCDAVGVTFADGTIFTMATQGYLTTSYDLSGGAENVSIIKLVASRIYKSSEWAGNIY